MEKNRTKHNENLKMAQTKNSLEGSAEFRRSWLKSVTPNPLDGPFPPVMTSAGLESLFGLVCVSRQDSLSEYGIFFFF